MKSVNKVILVGNVGKAPETKYTPQGTAVATFSIACNERYKPKDSDEWQDRVEWVNVKAWAKLAEIVEKYVEKGSQIYVEGKLNTQSWEDKGSGKKMYRTEVVANDIVLLGSKGERRESSGGGAEDAPIDDSDIPF